jgi:hypothetical protein
MTDSFLYTSPTAEISRPLIEQLTAEYHVRYGEYLGEPASPEMNRYPPERFAPPYGGFVLLHNGTLGYSRIYLTTAFLQPEAVGLYLKTGYTALFDATADPETIQILPFEKALSEDSVL